MALELPWRDGYRISRIVCLIFSWMSLRILQFFLCQLEENHHLEVPQDLYKLLFERNLEIKCKVGCIFLMVTVSLLPRAVFGPTDHREDPPHFTRKPFSLKMILPPIKRTYCPLRSILAFVLVKTFPATEWSTISHQEIFIRYRLGKVLLYWWVICWWWLTEKRWVILADPPKSSFLLTKIHLFT